MQQNSAPPLQPPQQCHSIFQKACEQIDQQFQTILSSLSTSLPSTSAYSSTGTSNQANNKLIQKCMASGRSMIMRILNIRLPQIISIQQKYKRIIVEVSQELDMQKKKCRELFTKYEQVVLQIDRYKMQTVQIGQLYESLYKQYMQLKSQPTLTNTNYLTRQQELQQKNQQRQLFHKQLSKNNELIIELRNNQQIANQRIGNLIQENKTYEQIILQKQITVDMLKKQIGELVVEAEEMKMKMEEIIKQGESRLQELKEIHGRQVTLLKQTIGNLQIICQKSKKNEQDLNTQNAQLQQSLTQTKTTLIETTKQKQQKQSQIHNLQNKIAQLQKILSQLQHRAGKIKDISKNQQKLQQKYGKKIALLTKSNKQISEKVTFYKNQNQRLYEAMEQYANKQIKLNAVVKNYQAKIQNYKNKQTKVHELKKKMLQFCASVKRQISFVRKNMSGQLQKNIKSILTAYKQQFITFRTDYQQKLAKKLHQLHTQSLTLSQHYQQKLQCLQNQNKILHKARLQSQINSNKIASSLVTSKNQVSMQLIKKDQIIQALQMQLMKEKQINQVSIRKLGDVVRKYELVQGGMGGGGADIGEGRENGHVRGGMLGELDNQISLQNRRYAGLKSQFQGFLKK